MATPLYKTHRKPEMTRRLIFRLTMTIIVLAITVLLTEPRGTVFKSGGFFINIFIGLLLFRILILLMMLRGTRHPFVIYSDHFKFSFLWAIKRPLSDVIGRENHKKTGQLCLLLEHPRAEDPYQLKLPWNFIAESETEVAAKIDALILKQTDFE